MLNIVSKMLKVPFKLREEWKTLDICLPKLHQIFEVPDDTVLHIEDIAKLVNMHEESVRRWCRNGKLPSYNFGNKYIVVGEDFKNFMKSSKVKSGWEQKING